MNSVINLLKIKAETMEEYERVCIVSFDECSIAYEWCYDKGTDTLYDPKSKVQCVITRGMANSWKQLVYYNFDCHMTKEILFDLII